MREVKQYQIPVVKGEVAASAATSNLMVHIDDPKTAGATIERAEYLAIRLRARLMVLDATQTPSSAELVPPPQTAVRCDLQLAGLSPTTVLPLVKRALRSGLPTCLWWNSTDGSNDDVILLGLAEFARYLVLDTAAAGNNFHAISDLAHISTRIPKLALNDLAWARTASWRDAVARFFDDHGVVSELSRMIRIELEGSSESESLYVLGWLASRLGWAIAGDQRFVDRQGNPIHFFFHRLADGSPPLAGVRLRSASAEFHAHLSEPDEAITCSYGVNGTPVKRHVLPYQPVDDLQLIERALLRNGTDELFEAALRIVRDLGSLHD